MKLECTPDELSQLIVRGVADQIKTHVEAGTEVLGNLSRSFDAAARLMQKEIQRATASVEEMREKVETADIIKQRLDALEIAMNRKAPS